jgi:hypothetical protein
MQPSKKTYQKVDRKEMKLHIIKILTIVITLAFESTAWSSNQQTNFSEEERAGSLRGRQSERNLRLTQYEHRDHINNLTRLCLLIGGAVTIVAADLFENPNSPPSYKKLYDALLFSGVGVVFATLVMESINKSLTKRTETNS